MEQLVEWSGLALMQAAVTNLGENGAKTLLRIRRHEGLPVHRRIVRLHQSRQRQGRDGLEVENANVGEERFMSEPE